MQRLVERKCTQELYQPAVTPQLLPCAHPFRVHSTFLLVLFSSLSLTVNNDLQLLGVDLSADLSPHPRTPHPGRWRMLLPWLAAIAMTTN